MKTMIKLSALGFVLFASAFTPFAKGDAWNKKTIFTIHGPIRIEGKVLEPGQYVMQLLDSADRSTVQIFDMDQAKLETTVRGISVSRLEPTSDVVLTLSESPAGQPPALHTWFYPGDQSGLEFTETR